MLFREQTSLGLYARKPKKNCCEEVGAAPHVFDLVHIARPVKVSPYQWARGSAAPCGALPISDDGANAARTHQGNRAMSWL
jgi:hypothetical protein